MRPSQCSAPWRERSVNVANVGIQHLAGSKPQRLIHLASHVDNRIGPALPRCREVQRKACRENGKPGAVVPAYSAHVTSDGAEEQDRIRLLRIAPAGRHLHVGDTTGGDGLLSRRWKTKSRLNMELANGRYENLSARRQERAATMAHATPNAISDRTGACVQ